MYVDGTRCLSCQDREYLLECTILNNPNRYPVMHTDKW